MSHPWLRLWVEMPNDPKFRTVARISKQPISLVLAVYIHLLCGAANATERGRTQPNAAEHIASSLDVLDEEIEEIMAAMQGRLLDRDVISGWEKRQPLREDGSAARAKAYREEQRRLSEERNRTQANAEKGSDTDTDTDKNKRRESASAKRGTRLLLADMPIEWGEFCRKERPDLSPVAVFAMFRDHWTAKTGKDATRLDWFATWRNWVRRERAAPKAQGHKYADVIAGLTGRSGPVREVNMGDVVDVPARLVR